MRKSGRGIPRCKPTAGSFQPQRSHYSRVIPLSTKAVDVLQLVIATNNGSKIFPLTANALRQSWERLLKRANVQDLHFHDLRHEAISRFVEKGLSIPEVALISGHRDYRMLFKYTHLKPQSLVAKLQ
jgi:integrase